MPLYGSSGAVFTYLPAAPTAGTWSKGNIVFNSNPIAGGPPAWEYLGSGVWVPWGALGQPITLAPANYTLNVAAPANNATVSGVIQFQIQAPGFVNVEVWNSGKVKLISGTPDANGNLILTYNTAALPNGSNALTVNAWDAAAGQAYSNTASVSLTLNVSNAVSSLILPPAIAGKAFSLVWSDEFDTNLVEPGKDPTVNGGKWATEFWFESLVAGQTVSVANSILKLQQTGTIANNIDIVSMYRPDATLSHRKGTIFKYGYFECKSRFTGNYQKNWPAFWLYSASNSGNTDANAVTGSSIAGLTPEFDIFEVNGMKSRDLQLTAHQNTGGGSGDGTGISDSTNTSKYFTNYLPSGQTWFDGTTWHTFGGLWTPTTLSWWVDGVQVTTWDISSGNWANSFADYMYIILSLQNGDEGLTSPDTSAATSSNQFIHEIDYVRVYQDANGSIVNL